jgi:hypothetical protein
MLDLSFGLPIVVRDAALKMVAPGPQSDINRQYYAQEHEREIEEGRGAMEAYEKTDEKARDLLKRLAQSEPYYKKQRRMEAEADESGQKALPAPGGNGESSGSGRAPGPIRTRDTKGTFSGRGGARPARGGRMGGLACHHQTRMLHLCLSLVSKTIFLSTSSAPTSHNTVSLGRLFARIGHIAHTSITSRGRMQRRRQRHSRAKSSSRAVR